MQILRTLPEDQYFEHFKNFPKLIYTEDQLSHKTSENINFELLKSAYILLIDGQVKARLALYNNPHLRYDDKAACCIGNYECVEDLSISKALIQFVLKDAKTLNVDFVIGPMNGSTWDTYRFSTSNSAANFILEPYHHIYYNDHFKASGFGIIGKYISNKDSTLKLNHPEVLRRTDEFVKQGITFRSIVVKDFETELGRLYDFNAEVFKRNFLYTPVSKEAFIKKNLPLKPLLDPEYVLIAEDENKNLVCFFFCLVNHLNMEGKSLIIKSIARHPDKRWSGLGHVLGNKIYQKAVVQGFDYLIHAFMYDDGYSKTITKNFSGENYKNYHLYGKAI